jgi:hypothetical protein
MNGNINSIPFLWAAYILIAVANIAYAGWLIAGWRRTDESK